MCWRERGREDIYVMSRAFGRFRLIQGVGYTVSALFILSEGTYDCPNMGLHVAREASVDSHFNNIKRLGRF